MAVPAIFPPWGYSRVRCLVVCFITNAFVDGKKITERAALGRVSLVSFGLAGLLVQFQSVGFLRGALQRNILYRHRACFRENNPPLPIWIDLLVGIFGRVFSVWIDVWRIEGRWKAN